MMTLTVLYLLMMAVVITLSCLSWRDNRRRLQAQEQTSPLPAPSLPALPSPPRIYYLPLGRTPALPPMMALPPYEALPGLTMPPTYPGDLPALPDDLYPLYEQEFDATVLAALERIGEW